jgi:hypothetical protein
LTTFADQLIDRWHTSSKILSTVPIVFPLREAIAELMASPDILRVEADSKQLPKYE